MKGRKFQVKFRGNTKVYVVDGKELTQAEFNEAFPDKPLGEPLQGHTAACWPMVSEALAVHPSQVDQANARNRKHGIAALYQKGTGACQIDSRGDRAKLLKLEAKTLGHAVFDKQGGYSDG